MSHRYGRIGETLRNYDSRALAARMKRNSEIAAFAMECLFDDDEAGAMKRARNTGPRPGGRNTHGSVDFSETTWGRMLREDHAELALPGSAAASLFRRRFRVPFRIFLMVRLTRLFAGQWLFVYLLLPSLRCAAPSCFRAVCAQIVDWVKKRMLGGTFPVDCVGRGGTPVEIKVLGVLRILGRATCFDGITELSGIPKSSMQAFFHRFTAWFRKDIYPEFVYVPKTREDLAKVETPYALVGLPGCIGSMDVVHIAWCMCPTYLMNLAKGKEGYPSIAYNVICDHKGRAQSVLAGTTYTPLYATTITYTPSAPRTSLRNCSTRFELVPEHATSSSLKGRTSLSTRATTSGRPLKLRPRSPLA